MWIIIPILFLFVIIAFVWFGSLHQIRDINRLEKQYADNKRIIDEIIDYNGLVNKHAYKSLNQEQAEFNNDYDIINYTGNAIFDSALSFKKREADNNNIRINICIGDSRVVSEEKNGGGLENHFTWRLNESDTVALIFNLMDNSIEAASKCKDAFIRIDIEASDRLKMLFENSKYTCFNNDMFYTTKHNSREHGFGIEVIREIVDKYDGKAEFEDRGDTFAVKLELPC